MKCPKCNHQNEGDAVFCNKCGFRLAEPPVQPSQAQPAPPQGARKPLSENAGMRAVLPIGRSGVAIAAGYLGIFSIIPGVGLAALALGIIAIFHIKNNPGRHGMGRAIFAIIAGIVSMILYGVALVA